MSRFSDLFRRHTRPQTPTAVNNSQPNSTTPSPPVEHIAPTPPVIVSPPAPSNPAPSSAISTVDTLPVQPTDNVSTILATARRSNSFTPKRLDMSLTTAADAVARAARPGYQLLDKSEELISTVQGQAAKTAALIQQVNSLFDSTADTKGVEQRVNRFVEGSTLLMNALDEVQKLHPFIGVAVMAFKAVWKLEEKRRDNEKKVLALYTEMADMMRVLLQLKDVSDPKAIGTDGTTVEGRMQGLVLGAANDIKACANTCDTYSRKKLIIKVLQGPIWDMRLVEYVGVFADRRAKFEFALAIHTAVGVDAANIKLVNMDQKMEIMLELFRSSLLSQEQKDLYKLVDQKGGLENVRRDDAALKDLSSFAQHKSTGSLPDPRRRDSMAGAAKPLNISNLKKELDNSPNEEIDKNMGRFMQKVEVQTRQIKDQIRQEADRVITAVTAGPHDKIIDPDLRELWKQGNWRGSVKARTFIMAFKDHYQDKIDRLAAEAANTLPPTSPASPTELRDMSGDAWALQYLTLLNLQPILEAFDDDASGFVTVAEANKFTIMRPFGWSLPEWTAFWAVGWHMSMFDYKEKIEALQAKMFAILPKIHPANRASADDYLITVDRQLTMLTTSLNWYNGSDAVKDKFRAYMESEEARLESNLRTFGYEVDALETVALITGPGRIERFIFPLVYILLKRHFEIFRICRQIPIAREELNDAAASLRWCFVAVDDRAADLYTVFKQQKLDPKEHFQAFAHGIFDYWYSPDLFSAGARDKEWVDLLYDDEGEAKNVKPEEILRHGIGPGLSAFDLAVETQLSIDAQHVGHFQPGLDRYSSEDGDALAKVEPFLGVWNGVFYTEDGTRTEGPMFTVILHAHGRPEDLGFQGSTRIGDVIYTTTGTRALKTTEDGRISVKFQCKAKHHHSKPTITFSGHFNTSDGAITGERDAEPEVTADFGPFLLSRLPPDLLRRFRPTPSALATNKPRALWTFAFTVIQEQRTRHRSPSMSRRRPTGASLDPLLLSGVPSEMIGHYSPSQSALESNKPRALWDFATSVIQSRVRQEASTKRAAGTFLLSRLPPELLRLCPRPDDLRRNRPRAMWHFAISASVYQVRERMYVWDEEQGKEVLKWRWSHFKWRRDDRKRYIALINHADAPPYRPLADFPDLYEEHRERQKLHTPTDDLVYRSLAKFQAQATVVNHGMHCDSCQNRIDNTRIICLDCQTPKRSFGETIDLCIRCENKPVIREDLVAPHIPTHELMKVRRVLHQRQHPKLDREARLAIRRAKVALQRRGGRRGSFSLPNQIVINVEGQGVVATSLLGAIACHECRRTVTIPCWFCVECEDDVFICSDCDSKEVHDETHALVKCHADQQPAPQPAEGLRQELAEMLEARLAPLDARLGRLENMLAAFLGQMGHRTSTGNGAILN